MRALLGHENAIVVAHPDDEVLWAAGLPLRFNRLKWTVICCSRPSYEPQRIVNFFRSCEALGTEGIMLSGDDTGRDDVPLSGLDALSLAAYDAVITHNAEGEYGHPHHRQVHEAVKGKFNRKIITFGFRMNALGEHRLSLSPIELERKKMALRRYDNVIRYQGKNVLRWMQLEQRYFGEFGVPFAFETYDEAQHSPSSVSTGMTARDRDHLDDAR